MTTAVLSGTKFNVYHAITEKIVAAIEAGAGTFTMPWHRGRTAAFMPINAMTEAPYRGVNVILLWADAMAKGFGAGHWASYRQWKSLGAQVRAGEKGSMIVFFKKAEPSDEKQDEERAPLRFIARASHVFNVAQVDGWQAPMPEWRSDFEINQEVEAFVQATNAEVRHGFDSALYRPREDRIEMPAPEQFFGTDTRTGTEAYYSVLLHELTHWSGAAHRLNRQFGERFGDRAYAFEELVAELGAAFLCAAFGVANEPRDDHVAYLSSWLEILDRDYKAIFTAASQAQQAVEYLHKLAGATLNMPNVE
jgi:antirestriction protein ArdC